MFNKLRSFFGSELENFLIENKLQCVYQPLKESGFKRLSEITLLDDSDFKQLNISDEHKNKLRNLLEYDEIKYKNPKLFLLRKNTEKSLAKTLKKLGIRHNQRALDENVIFSHNDLKGLSVDELRSFGFNLADAKKISVNVNKQKRQKFALLPTLKGIIRKREISYVLLKT